MNVTFLIGNGFDINLGLRMKYTDFIEIYREIQPQDNEIIKKFKGNIIEKIFRVGLMLNSLLVKQLQQYRKSSPLKIFVIVIPIFVQHWLNICEVNRKGLY